LWGILVFGELHGRNSSIYLEVIGGSLLMMLGVGAIAFFSATGQEQTRLEEAAIRESDRYSVPADFVEGPHGRPPTRGRTKPSRSVLDWLFGSRRYQCLCYLWRDGSRPANVFALGPGRAADRGPRLVLIISGLASGAPRASN